MKTNSTITKEQHEHHIKILTEVGKYNRHKENVMRRSEALMEKRKEFMEWYIERYQNEKTLQQCVKELSGMVFISTTRIYQILAKNYKTPDT